jgi:gliding motility-associated-like protein
MNPGDPNIRYAGNGFYIGSIRNVSSTGSTTIGFSIDGNPSAQHVVLRYVPIPSIPPDPKPETEETDNNNSDTSGNSGFGGAVVPKEPEPPVDSDADGIPDSEDPDDDNDGWLDIQEYNCECACSVNTKKSEAVPLSDPLDPNSVPLDSDGDNIADCVDTDDDNDGVNDENDAFPLDPSEWTDTDGDGIGNNADLDDDNDSWSDFDELSCGANPLNIFNSPSDIDQDGIADCVDSDRDGDGYLNTNDFFPDNSKEWSDADADGLGDNFDVDDDNDGILDSTDAFPLDPNEWTDTDGDGIGDNEDLDDNNDGFNDIDLLPSGLLTPNCNCSESVWRVVNIENHPASRVRVYNKSGHEVFSASGYKNDWEGTYNNKPLPAGSYYYIISINNVTPAKEGWLYLTY